MAHLALIKCFHRLLNGEVMFPLLDWRLVACARIMHISLGFGIPIFKVVYYYFLFTRQLTILNAK